MPIPRKLFFPVKSKDLHIFFNPPISREHFSHYLCKMILLAFSIGKFVKFFFGKTKWQCKIIQKLWRYEWFRLKLNFQWFFRTLQNSNKLNFLWTELSHFSVKPIFGQFTSGFSQQLGKVSKTRWCQKLKKKFPTYGKVMQIISQ